MRFVLLAIRNGRFKQNESTSATCRRTARKKLLDSKETQLHLMMKDLQINRRAGGEFQLPFLVFSKVLNSKNRSQSWFSF